jgi:hypothetical protein
VIMSAYHEIQGAVLYIASIKLLSFRKWRVAECAEWILALKSADCGCHKFVVTQCKSVGSLQGSSLLNLKAYYVTLVFAAPSLTYCYLGDDQDDI